MNNINELDVNTLPESFFISIIASRRSGKSVLIQSLLGEIQQTKKRFDTVLLFSSTDAGFEDIEEHYRFKDLAYLDTILEKMKQIKEVNKSLEKNYIKARICVILDDMAFNNSGNDSLRYNKTLIELALNGRHLNNPEKNLKNGISVILISQTLKSINKSIRLNCDIIMTNLMTNMIERNDLLNEYFYIKSDRKSINIGKSLYDEIVRSKEYRFLVIERYKSIKRELEDYISYYDAKINKNGKMKFKICNCNSTFKKCNDKPKIIKFS